MPQQSAAALAPRPRTGRVSERAPAATNWRALSVAAALAFVQDAVYAMLLLTFMNHYLLDVLEAAPSTPGIALAAYGAVRLATNPAAGWLLDRTGARIVTAVALTAQVAGVACVLVAPGVGSFVVAAGLVGLGAGAMWPLIYDTVARAN